MASALSTMRAVAQAAVIPGAAYVKLLSSGGATSALRHLTQSSQSSAAAPAAAAAADSAPAYPRGFVEVREYTLKPEGMLEFLQLSADYADVRKELLPLLGIFTADVGSCLHKVTHFYHYRDFDERDAVRHAAGKDARWREYVRLSRPFVQHQENKVMLEASAVYETLGMPPTKDFKSTDTDPASIYELRTYLLHPGYGSVPKLLDAFQAGLPSKVAADPAGRFAFFGHSDVGTLNHVMELWRYPSAQACIRARQAARKVPEWRETIGKVTPTVQHFTSTFLKPLPWSPMR